MDRSRTVGGVALTLTVLGLLGTAALVARYAIRR